MDRTFIVRWHSFLIALSFFCGVSAQAQAHTVGPALTVRIYDYDQTTSVEIQQTEREVGQTFAAAGVSIDWHEAVAPDDIEAGRADWPTDGVAAITVVILRGGSGPWSQVPADVAGFAPITRERGGRIAYVLGDRVRDIATIGGAEPFEVLAGVIAHEMAHLLLPNRRHGFEGVLRAHWKPNDFRRTTLRRFSADEANALRGVMLAKGSGGVRVAD